jgi:predicted membrane-bound spermidine synthase
VHATAIRFAVAFLLMILPTALMGATLPFVVTAATRAGYVAAIGVLYGSNTSGAIAGALAAGLWLIPIRGMRATFVVAASLNVLAALSAVFLSRARTASEIADVAIDSDERMSADALSPASRKMVLATFTVSGAVALALEVIWLRSATIILGPTVYTVAVLLATILAGIALGSYCITPLLVRVRRPLIVLAALEGLIAFRHSRVTGHPHENASRCRRGPRIVEGVGAAVTPAGHRRRCARGASNFVVDGPRVPTRVACVDPHRGE